jgi:hypothetical protein
LSDRGTEFVNEIVDNINNVTGVLRKVTSGYRPQTNGQCEKHNHLILQTLRKFAANNLTDWDQYLPFVQLADRNRPRVRTGYTPMYLLFGHESVLFSDFTLLPPYKEETEDAILRRLEHINKLIEVIHPTLARRLMKRAKDAHAKLDEIPALEKGTYVQVKRKDYEKVPKLRARYVGLYRVIERATDGNYKLETLRGVNLPFPVHPTRMRPIGKALALRLLSDPDPRLKEEEEAMSNEDVYEVDKIVTHKVTNKGLVYEIMWKGYPESTWEPERNLIHCDELLKAYWTNIHNKEDGAKSLEDVLRDDENDEVNNICLIAPKDITEECIVALRPCPSHKLQWWIRENIGYMDADLLSFQSKMMFCKAKIDDLGDLSNVKSIWINSPFKLLPDVFDWLKHVVPKANKEIVYYLLAPEWLDRKIMTDAGLEISRIIELPDKLDPLFAWPNGMVRNNVHYKCTIMWIISQSF